MASKLDQGEVMITLGDKEYTLKPSIGAMRALSRQYGGLLPAAQQIQAFNIDAWVFVVRQGAQLSDEAAKGLDKRIYDAGLDGLMQPLVTFVNLLSNGGRPATVAAGDDDGDAPAGN